jgi:uncharacterized protein
MDHPFALMLTGATVGLIVGITGVGGGSLMTPALINLFGVPPLTAVASDLGFAAITKSAGVLAHRRTRQVRWTVAVVMMVFSCLAAVFSLRWMQTASLSLATVSRAIRIGLCVALTLTVVALIFQRRLTEWRAQCRSLSEPARWLLTIAASLIIGMLVAVSSIGAGAIGVTVLALLYPEWQPREIAATDLAYAVPLTAVSATLHAIAGNIDWNLLFALLAGSVPAIVIGVKLGAHLRPGTTRALLAGCLSVAAVKLAI